MENKFLETAEGRFFYRVGGNGKPVVLLHGFGEDGNIWHNQAPVLEEQYQLIIPDIPGSGQSDLLKKSTVDLKDYANTVKSILESEQIEKCTIIGHSMGGYTALAFAELYPDKMNGLGLFHSSAFADNEEKIATRRKSIDFIKQNGAAEFLKTAIPGLYSESTKQRAPELLEQHLRSAQFTNEALIQYYDAMISRPDRIRILKEIKQPVLFIIGELDQAIPLDQSLKQCHIPSISHVHILPEVAHMGMVEAPQNCNEYLIKFLQNI